MGVSNHLLTADSSEAEAIAGHDDPSRNWEGFYYQGLDSIKLAMLCALLESGSVEGQYEARMEAIRTIAAGEQGPWVDVLPNEMVKSFASLASMDDEELSALSSVLLQVEDFSSLPDDDVIALMRTIGDQAESAELEGKTLMLYTCL